MSFSSDSTEFCTPNTTPTPDIYEEAFVEALEELDFAASALSSSPSSQGPSKANRTSTVNSNPKPTIKSSSDDISAVLMSREDEVSTKIHSTSVTLLSSQAPTRIHLDSSDDSPRSRETTTVMSDLRAGRADALQRHKKKSMHRIEEAVVPNVEALKISEPGDKVDDRAGDDADQNDSEDEVKQPVAPIKISQRKAADKVAIDQLMEKLLQPEYREAKKTAEVVLPANFNTLRMFRDAADKDIISSPREYQNELFEIAKQRNVIAVLDTGSGKTLIAVLLLRHTFQQELEARAVGKPNKLAFFLVNSVTLAHQQFAVLQNNLPQPMSKFCGGMKYELWDKAHWDDQRENNMAIVCTADVLHHCLHRGFLSMSQINLLIFDEAHHAKKGNVYARIIKDFYTAEPDLSKRPKIFGMTASPVDSKTEVQAAAAQLEGLLHAKIITASDPNLLRYAPVAKKEEIVEYQTLHREFQTPLHQAIRAAVTGDVLRKTFIFAQHASADLGAWCSDEIWRMSLSETQVCKLEATIGRNFHSKNIAQPIFVLDNKRAEIRKIQEIMQEHDYEEPRANLSHLSSKVLELMSFLHSRFERTTNDKCIVFVNQRYTAMVLTELFRHKTIGTPHLRPGFLIGQQSDDISKTNVNWRAQVKALNEFREGDINCLFATSVAEEGLDIPDCNLVIRFDLYTTLIQYIQSRGRARLPNSHYIHMLEQGNREHAALLKEVFDKERVLRRFCQGLDGDRLLVGNDYDMDFFLAKEKKHRIYVEPETGSKLTYRLSLMVLENFTSSLPHSEDDTQRPAYIMTHQGLEFVCEVILPSNSKITGAMGRPSSTKQVAKCSAAFEACLALRRSGYLDGHFISTLQKQAPLMRNAHLAINSKKQTSLTMRTKPTIWSLNTIPVELFLTIITLPEPEQLNRASQPLGILTRTRLPIFPSIPLHFGINRKSMARPQSLSIPFTVNVEMMNLFNNFTLRIYQDIFSKEYEPDISKMPYFLVPIQADLSIDGDMDNRVLAEDIIAWDILDLVKDRDVKEIPMIYDADETWYCDRFIVDIFDGSRKFYSIKQAHGQKPLDPLPDFVAPRSGRRNNSSIMEYSISLWPAARAKRTYKEDQPVIEAELIGLRRNLLDDNVQAEDTAMKKCLVILEPLRISVLPTTVVAMAFVMPAIIHRLESYLVVVEGCTSLGLNIRADLALEAFTKDSDNSEEHNQKQIQFQRGMGKNYERLEFLGDCFLKMAVSIALYGRHPEGNEQDYHVSRMLLICNLNLLNVATKLKLHEYIRSQGFNRRAWYPEGLKMITGKDVAAPSTHGLSDKTIADVSEALIGAALLSRGVDHAVKAVKALVDSEEHPMSQWSDYYKSYNLPAYQLADTSAPQRWMADQIFKIHPYKFIHPRVLRSAFQHPSYPRSYENLPSYERLEFLGDSLFDMAAISYLFHAHPDRDPQWLTEHKMAMVSNQFLGALCVHLGFHSHLQQWDTRIAAAVNDYAEELRLVKLCAEEDAIREGKTAKDARPDWWTSTKSPPKCLPDIVEAYMGAVFVDSAYDYSEVEKFFDLHVKHFFEDMTLYDTFANKHPVTFLTKMLEVNMGCQQFAVRAREIPDLGEGEVPKIVAMVLVHGKVVAFREGTSAKYAKVAVAKIAIEMLGILGLGEFREQYGCGCRIDGKDDEAAGGTMKVVDDEVVDHGTAI